MKKVALIFAGGTGQRMGSEIPKQFLKVYGKEIIIHTLELFETNENIDEIYVVCIEEWIPHLEALIKRFDVNKVKKIVSGGANSQDSIFRGLDAIYDDIHNDYHEAIALIHDGVRPLVNEDTIAECVKAVIEYRSAVVVTPCFETPILSIDGQQVEKMPPRSIVYTAQAPQCFYLNDIYSLHLSERISNPNYDGIVDSCGLMFKHGVNCHLVEGNRGNIKVTTADDFFTLIGNYTARDYQQLLSLNEENKNRHLLQKR